jgi:hypothetical protein
MLRARVHRLEQHEGEGVGLVGVRAHEEDVAGRQLRARAGHEAQRGRVGDAGVGVADRHR